MPNTPSAPSTKPEILVVNDDGITAKGILNLVHAVKDFGNLTIVAPDSPQSGMGHAISVGKPLRIQKVNLDEEFRGFACSGTPVDCVKLATGHLMRKKPDLVVSGINHGANSAISVFYSGTMSAAVEAAIENIPGIGFSLCDFSHDADFGPAREVVRNVVRDALCGSFPKHTALNVNIPAVGLEEIKGIKVCRQAQGRFVEEFDKRYDPHNRTYFWLTGKFQLEDNGQDTDIWALDNNYVSLCPVEIDATAHHAMGDLNQWDLKLGN